MELFTPETGLIFWMILVFLSVLFILGKFAWPTITQAIAKREQFITDAVRAAEEAHEKLERIKEERIAILSQTREEQNVLLKEVQLIKEKLIEDAKTTARTEADRLISDARLRIQGEKEQALKDVRNQVALLSISIAGKLLRKDLETDASQLELVNKMLDDVDLLKN